MRFLRALFIVFACCAAFAAHAEEEILNYDVTIEIQKNADLIITESITVNSEGRNIKRGIFRDLPRYKLDENDTIPYQYKILSVTKNGVDEPFDNSVDGNAKRVRIGDADVFLEDGQHNYVIRYLVKNEIRYGESFDELYWNVTGNYWEFTIDSASATVIFPTGTAPNVIQDINSYVGSVPPEESIRIASPFDPLLIEVTGRIGVRQGLTISVMFDKGIIDPPSAADKTLLWWFKNGALFLLSFSFIGLFAYYYRAWNKVGRDPAKLPLYPRYAPPKGYSAAAVGRLMNKHSGGTQPLIATLMSLAVKGAVHIDSKKKSTTINYLGTNALTAPLLADEAFLLQKLFNKKQALHLRGKYNATFTRAHTAFTSRISKLYSKDYFQWNTGYTVSGILLSVIGLFAAITQVYGTWKAGFTLIFIALILMNIVFLFLMPAPTQKGRDVTSEIEGFKLYLETAESKRFAKAAAGNVAQAPPTMTQELYERYLPYAVALDVEKPWSKYFEKMLPAAAETFSPTWGHIQSLSGNSASSFSKSLSANLSSGVSSSLPQSSSTSGGGGGGSSGGGGGGGGGGGW